MEYNKLSSSLYSYSREDDKKILAVCSYTEKEAPFKAPKGFDHASAELILQNYTSVDPALLKPYEVRVYHFDSGVGYGAEEIQGYSRIKRYGRLMQKDNPVSVEPHSLGSFCRTLCLRRPKEYTYEPKNGFRFTFEV